MHSHQVQILLLLFSFILSIFLLIAAAKYASWARVMISGQPSGSWLGLVFYIGSIPLLSLMFNALHLLALHFDILPSQLPANATSKSPSSRKPVTIEPGLFLLALFTTSTQTIMWLGQASLCTACELAPILAGTQGNVPKWCPQSNFRDSGDQDLPGMLASLATVKDIVSWLMVPLSAALIECSRRQWQRARVAAVQAANFDPGLREYDWKSGITIAAVSKQDDFELGPVPLPVARTKALPNKPPPGRDAVEIGMPPSRSNTDKGVHGLPVRAGLDVGMSYESRTTQPEQGYESRVAPQQLSYESRVQQSQPQLQPSSYETYTQQPTAYESRIRQPPTQSQPQPQLQRSVSRPTPPPLAGVSYETRIDRQPSQSQSRSQSQPQPPLPPPPLLQPQTYQSQSLSQGRYQNPAPYRTQNAFQGPNQSGMGTGMGMGRATSQKKGVHFDMRGPSAGMGAGMGGGMGGGMGYESRV